MVTIVKCTLNIAFSQIIIQYTEVQLEYDCTIVL